MQYVLSFVYFAWLANRADTSTPHFIALHGSCVFDQLKARPSTSKDRMIRFIAVVGNQPCDISEARLYL